jgi:hypothetical protein
MSETELPEGVGYGKPPQSGRFVKGKSGNPNGRPKGSKNLDLIVQREARELIQVKEGGKIRKRTKAEVAMKQLGNKAAQGDPRALREFFMHVRLSEAAISAGVSPQISREKDQKVLENLRRCLESIGTETKPINPESKTEGSK